MNTNRGETNSHWLHNNVVFCDADMMSHTLNCDTVVCETKNVINPILSHAISHSHHYHFHSLNFTCPQDGDLLKVLPGSQITFYTFDIMYSIHEIDNLLPVSRLIPKIYSIHSQS